MVNEAVRFSPKIEIINHFDELINRVDIEFDECLERFNEKQVLGDLECFNKERIVKEETYFNKIIRLYKSDKQETEDLWSESTKVIDYLNQVRMRTIEELRKGQEETLEYYKLNSSLFKSEEMTEENKIEELRSKLFGKKFHFQVRNTREEKPWVFNLFTFVTDFYMSQSDIDILEIFTNKTIESVIKQVKPIFDEKMVLISLLGHHYLSNLLKKYPSHVIFVSKQDILNIKKLFVPRFMKRVNLTCSSIDLSKLKKLYISQLFYSQEREAEHFPDDIELDGLSSLTFIYSYITSLERFSARNLKSLKKFHLIFGGLVDDNMLTNIFEHLSNIDSLFLDGYFSNLNLDCLVNLEKLSLSGSIRHDFNFGLFKNLCDQLQELSINLNFSDNEMIRLFDGHIFTNLQALKIKSSNMRRLEKRMFQGFPMLQTLIIAYNEKLGEIDYDAFSSLRNLVHLQLNNNHTEKIGHRTFSALINLETLDLSDNIIESIDDNTFSNLKSLKELDLSWNRQLSILNHQSLFGLENLTKLNLSYNNLAAFDIRILDIGKINEINIYINNLSSDQNTEILKAAKDIKIIL